MKLNNYFQNLMMTVLCLLMSISMITAQQDIEIDDDAIRFGDASGTTANPKISWDPDDAIFRIGGFGLNDGINMATSLTQSGKIGIGESNDLTSLITLKANSGTVTTPAHIHLIENNNSDFARLRYSNSSATDYWDIASIADGNEPKINFFFHNGTSGDNIMTIQGADDRVGINDATPSYTLDITHGVGSPGASGDNGIQIHQSGGSAAVDDWQLYVSSSSGELHLFAEGVKRGEFDEANGVYTSFSDVRLKSNIQPLENQLEAIMKLRPKKYEIKGHEGEFSFGLIAQEVLDIIPEVVSETDEDDPYMGLSYSELVPVLISGMQEQQATIESLKEEISELDAIKKELNELRAAILKVSQD